MYGSALDVEIWLDRGRTVGELVGELDMYSAPRLREELLAVPAPAAYRVALDLSRLEFIDSSGLGVLIAAVKRARAGGGALCLIAPPPQVASMLRITGLDKVMPIVGGLDAAFAHLDAR
ncbi:MAG: STAS domain-containing protein [Actinocrinis sp.]